MPFDTKFQAHVWMWSVVACLCAGSVSAMQDDVGAARARLEIGAEIEELGTTLRAAVMSGAMTAEQAREIHGRVTTAAKAAYARDFGSGQNKEEEAPSPKANVARLIAPQPDQVRALFRPELLRRDMQLLNERLNLDQAQASIVQFMLEDYLVAYDLAATPLREGLMQYRKSTTNSYIAFVLTDADVQLRSAMTSVQRVDSDESVKRMTEALARIDAEKADGIAAASQEDRNRYEKWKQSMLAATTNLDQRLSAIRERTEAQLTGMGREGGSITAEDLLDMARQLHVDREQLRTGFNEALKAIITPEQRGKEDRRFNGTMARIRIAHALPEGRLGGESMNLWAALQETARDYSGPADAGDGIEAVEIMLNERAPLIAAMLDKRTSAMLERELAGLEYRATRERIAASNGSSIFEIETDRLLDAARPYATAVRRELQRSLEIRDALLALLDESSSRVNTAVADAGASVSYRVAALRRGFPIEMQPRWAEQALAVALQIDGLDASAAQAVRQIESDMVTQLQLLRERAIAVRIQRDPKLANEFIEALFNGGKAEVDEDVWREVEFAAFAAVDERVETQLRATLTAQQLQSLPMRSRAESKDAGAKKIGSGKSGRSG